MEAHELFRRARAALGLTQRQLAKELGYPLTGPIVSLIENGKLLPGPELVERLSDLLNQQLPVRREGNSR